MPIEMWSLLEIAYFLLFFLSDSLLGMLSHTAGGSLTFFWTECRKELSLVAENTQFVRACVLSEIDVMALIPPSGEKSSKFSMESRPRTYRWTRCRPALTREGRERVEKVENSGCVRASRPITFAGSSVPTRETCVRCF